MRRAVVVGVLRSAVVLALVCAGPALAARNEGRERGSSGTSAARDEGGENAQRREGRGRPAAHWVPEFDPATAGAVAVLLAGGGVLVARRGKRKP